MKKRYYLFVFTFLFSISISAQTGPGGVGSSSNNVIWLDGNIITAGTYPYIATWPDQSGNGNDFSQATASKQPYVETYYGHKAVKFDGNDDFLRNGGIAALNTNTNTQYIVYNGNTPDHVGMIYEESFTQSNYFYRTFRYTTGNVHTIILDNLGGGVSNYTANSSSFQIISSVWDGTAQTFNSYKDGTAIGSKTGANGNPTGNFNNTIGASYNDLYNFDGDMGEIIIYNTTINSAQRKIVDNYLSSKFNVAIANEMYAYDGGLTHRYQVIGIGQEADGNNLIAQGKGIVKLSVASLNNGDYVFTGHNNTALTLNTNDVPSTILGGSRLQRTWRVDVTGTPGNIDVAFDVSSLTLPSGSYYLLVESNDGVFNNGGVVQYGPFADVGGIVSFTGISFADGDYFSLASGTNAAITSITTGNWDAISTWSCNCIPGATDDVSITLGHTVSALSTTNVKNLIINGTLDAIQTGDFNIKGDLTINAGGAFINKTVKFNGSVAQNMTNNGTSTIDFGQLIINNSNGVAVQTGNFSASNSLSVYSGPLTNTGGSFTFLSTATKTAVIINGAGGFSGNFTVQRYISQRNASWGDLSSPVASNHLRDWDSNPAGTSRELLMCGVNGLSGSCGGWNSVYSYNENTQAYVAVTDTGYVLAPGKGLELWLEDTNSIFYNTTFDSRGAPNYGNVAVTLANSWNIVGNPYQAWIDWSLLTRPTLTGTYYIWNTNNGSYDAATTGNIAPNQGFWVESTGSGTLTFTESAKLGSGSSLFYKTNGDDFSFPSIDNQEILTQAEEPYEFKEAKLKIKSNNYTYAHELKLRMNNLATPNLDEFDASFKPSRLLEAPSITAYSLNSNKKLAINSFNYQEEIIIPIAVTVGISGEHIIEAINFESFYNDYQYIELTDNKTGKVYNLKAKTKGGITFDINKEDNSDRFTLRLSNLLTQSSVIANSNVEIYKTNEHTVIEFGDSDENYEITVYNTIGQKVIESFYSENQSKILIPNNQLPHGINIIRVKSSQNNFIKKLNY